MAELAGSIIGRSSVVGPRDCGADGDRDVGWVMAKEAQDDQDKALNKGDPW